MPIYRYMLQREKGASLPAITSLILSVVMYASSSFITAGGMVKAFLQFFAAGIGVFGLYLLIRWNLTVFIYELTDDCLRIYRKTGKKELCVCDLTLQTGLSLVRKDILLALLKDPAGTPLEGKKQGNTLNYLNRFGEENPLCYLYADADTANVLILDYDTALEKELIRRIEAVSPEFRETSDRKEGTN